MKSIIGKSGILKSQRIIKPSSKDFIFFLVETEMNNIPIQSQVAYEILIYKVIFCACPAEATLALGSEAAFKVTKKYFT